MSSRLEGASSALALLRRYLRIAHQLRTTRAEQRRTKETLRRLLEEHRHDRAAWATDRDYLESEIQAEKERTADAERQVLRLQAENDIFAARDRLWLAWETRERARLDAETARQTAAKVRSVETPHIDEGDLR